MASNDRQSTDGIDRRTLLNGAVVVGGATLASSLVSGTAQAAPLAFDSPVVSFSLDVDGIVVGSFGELSTLVTELEPPEFLTSGSPINLKRIKPPSATLSRGVTTSTALWTWHAQVLSGDLAARKSANLTGFDQEGAPVVRFSLVNAWPAKLTLSSSEDAASPGAIETVTLVMDRVDRVSP